MVTSAISPRPKWVAHPRSRPRSHRATVGGSFQLRDVQLAHAQHGLHGALRARRVRVAAEFVERRGDYLPGDAEAVPEPAAHRLLASALLQALPVVVDLLLVLAAHVHGDGFRELEVRAAVVGVETLPAH